MYDHHMTNQIFLADLTDVIIRDVDMTDYPDFCDAWLEGASWSTDVNLTQEELTRISDDDIYEYIVDNQLYVQN